MKQQTVVWKSVKYPGMEYLTLREAKNYRDSVQVESVVIGVPSTGAFRLDYQIQCDSQYVVRDARVSMAGGATLHLTSDGDGNWFDANQQPIPDLNGCVDIDISATPFTNTLPIRRLTWRPGLTETVRVVYIAIPEMTIHADEQRYTPPPQIGGGLFRFEQVSSGFTTQLLITQNDGLVLDYPGLFERVKAS
jgi:hypothetical protein